MIELPKIKVDGFSNRENYLKFIISHSVMCTMHDYV